MSTPSQVPDFFPAQQEAPDFIPVTPQTLQAHASAQAPSSTIPPAYGFTPGHMLGQAAQGVAQLGQGIYALGKDVIQNPNWVTGPDSTLQKFVLGPAAEMKQKAQTAPTTSESLGYSAAEAIPLLGPWAANLGEQAGTGDVGGALARGGAQVAVPLAAGKAATVLGMRTRAAQSFSGVESKIGDAGINHQPVLDTAYKAAEMGAKGFTLPKVVTDFIDWAQAVKASQTPFKFADARDFYTSLGEKIPWDQYGGKGGRMYTQIMKMRSQLGDALKDTAAQNGLGDQYTQALKDYRRSSQLVSATKYFGSSPSTGPLGKLAGSPADIAAYIMRKAVNAGANAEPAVGGMARSVTQTPGTPPMSNLDLEALTSRRPGTAAEQQAIDAQRAQNAGRNQTTINPGGGTAIRTPEDVMNAVRQQRPELFTGASQQMVQSPGTQALARGNIGSDIQGKPPDMNIRGISQTGPRDVYIGYDAAQSFIDREAGTEGWHRAFAQKMFPGMDIQDARAVRQTLGAANRGGHGLHITFRNSADASNAMLQLNGTTNALPAMGNTMATAGTETAQGAPSTLNPEQRAAELSQWGPSYQGTPQTLSSQGGGGANFTAEDLAALKKRLGIP